MEETYELPSAERQDRLLAALGRLVALRGYQTLVHAPTLEPNARYFPDEWPGTVRGVRMLIRRLMHYAELDAVPIELELFDSNAPGIRVDDGGSGGFHEHNVAAWYAGIEDERIHFGLDVRRTRDPVELTGVLAHEVAHAYREHHGLMARDRDIEEELTDLTTIYLGFGVFSASSAFVYQTSGGFEAGMTINEWRIGSNGYLPAGEMAFLLAARSVARGDDAATTRALRKLLPVNQAHAFRSALKALSGDPAGLREQLGVPAPGEWSEHEPVAPGEPL